MYYETVLKLEIVSLSPYLHDFISWFSQDLAGERRVLHPNCRIAHFRYSALASLQVIGVPNAESNISIRENIRSY